MTRLFVAAWPPHELAVRLSELRPADEPGVRQVPVAQMHVTLRFLGDADSDDVAGRLVRCTLPAATAQVGPTVQQLGGGHLVVQVAGIDALADAVDDALDGVGAPRRRRYFGHITLARTRGGARSAIEDMSVSTEFPVDDVRLIESQLRSSGSEYTTVASVKTN